MEVWGVLGFWYCRLQPLGRTSFLWWVLLVLAAMVASLGKVRNVSLPQGVLKVIAELCTDPSIDLSNYDSVEHKLFKTV